MTGVIILLLGSMATFKKASHLIFGIGLERVLIKSLNHVWKLASEGFLQTQFQVIKLRNHIET